MFMPNFSSPASTQTDLDKYLTFFQGKFKIFLKKIQNFSNLKNVLIRASQKVTFVKILTIQHFIKIFKNDFLIF
jgi:hypothetical protein